MKIKVDGYILIAFIFSVLAIVIAILITVFSVNSNAFYSNFPAYAYHEYVDRSDDMVFKNGSGAQIYEAEKAVLSSGVNYEDNVGASNSKAVCLSKKDQRVKYSIKFNEDCVIQLKISLCYESSVGKDTNAKNLFSVYINDVEPYSNLANVKHCYNGYDFKENLIYSLEISKGTNVIEIISSGEDCYLDYMVLIPKDERTDNSKQVGHAYCGFDIEGLRQYYEAENAEHKESYIIQDEWCLGGYYVHSNQRNGKVSFFPNSSKSGVASVALVMKNNGVESRLSEFCDIFINGQKWKTDAICPSSNRFAEVYLGEISLKSGENEIRIFNKNGDYQLDYLILNTESNYSPNGYTLRYEAEDAKLSQSAVIANSPSASKGNAVKSRVSATEIEYNLYSYKEVKTHLAIRLSYAGESVRLCDLFAVYVNRTPIKVDDWLVLDMGDSQEYCEFYVGSVSFNKGNNEIEIYSLTDKVYYLDYITLYNLQAPNSGEELICEGEKANISKDLCEWDKTASGGKVVNFKNSSGEEWELKIQADEEITVELIVSLINQSSVKRPLQDCCTIIVNETVIDVSQLYIFATEKNGLFVEYNVGAITLQKGLNTVKIIGGSIGFYMDYIKFAV